MLLCHVCLYVCLESIIQMLLKTNNLLAIKLNQVEMELRIQMKDQGTIPLCNPENKYE